MTRLRVVSYNLRAGRPPHGPPGISAAAGVLAELEPDLCGLQEVLSWPPPFSRLDQPRRLAARTRLHVRFGASFGLRALGFGNALLSRWKPASTRRLWLPGRGEPRTLLHARIPELGHFLTTHLSLSRRDRLRQCRFLARYRRQLAGPVILAGDFNAEPASEELAPLLEAGLASAGPALTFPASEPRIQIDYVLVSPHWRVEACAAVRRSASDHLPLVADLVRQAGDGERERE